MRKIISFAIVCFASLLALLLIVGKNQLTPSVKNQTPPKFQAEEKPVVKNSTVQPQQNLVAAFGNIPPAAINAEKTSPNADQQDNQAKISSILQNLEPEEIANQFFDQQLKNEIENSSYEKFKPTILTENLRIIYKTDSQLSENYIKNLKKITDTGSVNIRNQFKDPSISDLSRVISLYQQIIESLYRLPVPENLLGIHKRELVLMETQKKIFELMQNYQDNPLQALLAFQAQENLNVEFVELKNAINEFISKN